MSSRRSRKQYNTNAKLRFQRVKITDLPPWELLDESEIDIERRKNRRALIKQIISSGKVNKYSSRIYFSPGAVTVDNDEAMANLLELMSIY